MKKILKILVIFIVLALVLIVFLIYPLFREIKKNSEELILEKGKLFSFETEIENLEQFKRVYQLLKPDLEKIDKLLINPEVPVDFIKFLEKTASDSEVFIEISPTSLKEAKSDPWPSLGFRISLTGSFPDFLKFLEKIESSSYLIEISNLNFKKISKKEKDINGNLFMKVYTK